MQREHHYHTNIRWTGNKGIGTSSYVAYDRNHVLSAEGKADILCSSDPLFRGDASKYNPEQLFVASLSSCHMLWYLHLCADAGVVVTSYKDEAFGIMKERQDGSGYFEEVILRPQVLVEKGHMIEEANHLHYEAHKLCFISNSVNFKVSIEPNTIQK